jgi:type I restriction enzyme S subunit
MVNMGELFGHGRVDSTLPMERVELSGKEREKFFLQADDLLFGRRSLVAQGAGRCSIMVEAEGEVTWESSIIRARLDQTKVNPHFYYYLFNSLYGRQLIWSIVEKVSVAGIRLSDLGRLSVPWASLDQQDRIVNLLRPYDECIDNLRQRSHTLENMARVLFRAWFVDYDPVRARGEAWPDVARLYPAELNDSGVPAAWQTVTLGDIAERVVQRVKTPEEWATERLIDLGRIPRDTITADKWGEGTEMSTSITRFSKGDILFGSIRPYLHKVCVAPFDGVTNTSVFVIRAKEEWLWPYLVILCSEASVVEYATRMSQGLKMPSVRWEDLASHCVAIPPRELLECYTSIVAPWLAGVLEGAVEANSLNATRAVLADKMFYEIFNGSSAADCE